MTKKGMKRLVNSGACVGVLAWLIYFWRNIIYPIPEEGLPPHSIIEWIIIVMAGLFGTVVSCILVYAFSAVTIILFCNFCGFREKSPNHLDDDETYTDNKNEW